MSRLRRQEVDVLQLELLRSGHATVQDAASPSAAGVKSAVTSTALKPSSRRKGEPKPLSLMVPPPTFSSAAPAPPLLRSLASQLLDTPNALVVKEAAVSARLLLAAGRGSSQPMPRAPKSRWRGCAREPGAHHWLSRMTACLAVQATGQSWEILGRCAKNPGIACDVHLVGSDPACNFRPGF